MRMRKKNQWELEKRRIKDAKPSGLREKLGSVSCWESIVSEVGTFRTPRYVCVQNWYLAGMWWGMFALVSFYIALAVFYDYQYLGKTTPEVSPRQALSQTSSPCEPQAYVGGWAEKGKMYSSDNSALPPYCNYPSYTIDAAWNYTNIGCSYFPMADVRARHPHTQFVVRAVIHPPCCAPTSAASIGEFSADVEPAAESCAAGLSAPESSLAACQIFLKRVPSFQFFTTFMNERVTTTGSCQASATCNQNTPGVTVSAAHSAPAITWWFCGTRQ